MKNRPPKNSRILISSKKKVLSILKVTQYVLTQNLFYYRISFRTSVFKLHLCIILSILKRTNHLYFFRTIFQLFNHFNFNFVVVFSKSI